MMSRGADPSTSILTEPLRQALDRAQQQINALVLGKPQEVRLALVALLAGMSRQRTNAALQRLAQGGLIELGTRRITVHDLAGLRAWG